MTLQRISPFLVVALLGCKNGNGGTAKSAEDGGGTASDAANSVFEPDTEATDAAPLPVNASLACITYCDTIQAACSGTHAQFLTRDGCLRACSFYPVGAPSDSTNNSLACRQQHAEAALTVPSHCHHAGAYGFDGCGTSCAGFCQLALGWCGLSAGPFATLANCLAACASFKPAPPLPDGTAAFSADGPIDGDTLDCRQAQLVAALSSASSRDVFCPRIGAESAACR